MQINNTIDLSGNAGGSGVGEVGPIGPQGIQGEVGPQGVPGVDGADGIGGGGSYFEKLRFTKDDLLVNQGEILLGGSTRYVPEVDKKIKKVTIALDNNTLTALGIEIRDVATLTTLMNNFGFTFANNNTIEFAGQDELLLGGASYRLTFLNFGDTSANLNKNLNIIIEVENA